MKTVTDELREQKQVRSKIFTDNSLPLQRNRDQIDEKLKKEMKGVEIERGRERQKNKNLEARMKKLEEEMKKMKEESKVG